jgi:transcriptional regulator with XRE-family HTH domain
VLTNIKTALAARRLKQADLAVRLGISPTAMSEVIHERRIPGAELRARIARELVADENWLFSSLIDIPGPDVSKSCT